jgi:hypothetical protein
LLLALHLAAQSAPAVPRTVQAILHATASSNINDREKAFDEASKLLDSPGTAANDIERLRLGLIQLLTAENARNNISDEEMAKLAGAASCGNGTDNCEGAEEDDPSGDYMSRLVAVVSGFNDERAIPALVGAMSWGENVTKALLDFGDKAIGPVKEQLKSKTFSLRESALRMSIKLQEARHDPASRTRIKELIESSLADPHPAFRSFAVMQIVCLPNREDFVQTLGLVAKTDPWKLPGKVIDGGDGGQFYPVRYQARRALTTIQSDGACLE